MCIVNHYTSILVFSEFRGFGTTGIFLLINKKTHTNAYEEQFAVDARL